MVTDVYIVHNSDININGETNLSPFFHFIDERTRHGKSEGYKLKHQFGAKLSPFVICYDKEKPIKGFWSESGEDVIKSLINYLNE